MAKTKIVGPLSIEKEGAKKIWKSFLLTTASAGVVAATDLVGIIDFGSWQNLAVVFVPFVLNVLRKWVGTYEVK